MAFFGEKPAQESKEWRQLSREEIITAAQSWDQLPVKVRRKSGTKDEFIEGGWLISGTDESTGKIRVIKGDGSGQFKFYTADELADLQTSPKTPEEKASLIENAQTFEELFMAISEIGEIQGSRQFYNPKEIIDLINDVRLGREKLTIITNAHSLRGKVAQLLGEQLRQAQK